MPGKIITRYLERKADRVAYIRRHLRALGGCTRAAWLLKDASGVYVSPSKITSAIKRGSIPYNWCAGLKKLVPTFDPFCIRRDYDYECARAEQKARFQAEKEGAPA